MNSTGRLHAHRSAVSATDLAWRVLTLVNVFRLLVPLLLLVLFMTLSPSPMGQVYPTLFMGAIAAYFMFAAVAISGLKRRSPGIDLQASIHICMDVVIIATLTYASGGMTSGLAALLVLPVGA